MGSRALLFLSLALCVWILCVEVGVGVWYQMLESHLKPSPNWALAFPKDKPMFKTRAIDAKTQDLLRFDHGQEAEWQEPDGSQWQVFFCSWDAGRVAGYLAKRHTPEICLPATGQKMISGPKLTVLSIHGAILPVRSYVFESQSGLLHVFHCRWEAGADADAYVQNESARFNLVRGIWAGRGNHGQKVLEMIVAGYSDQKQAEKAFLRQLEKLVVVEKSVGTRPMATPTQRAF